MTRGPPLSPCVNHQLRSRLDGIELTHVTSILIAIDTNVVLGTETFLRPELCALLVGQDPQ